MNQWSKQIVNPVAIRERELLQNISHGPAGIEAFLREFGHRGPNEMDLSAPRWRECPDTLESAAEALAAVPSRLAQTPDAQPAEVLLRDALVRNGTGCFYGELVPLLRQALALLPYREIGKHEWLKAYDLLRTVITELSRRWNLRDELYFLTTSEFSLATPDYPFDLIVPARRDIHRTWQQLHVAPVIDAVGDLADFGKPLAASGAGRVFQATRLSPGRAVGRVQLLSAQQALPELAMDSVIVASTIDAGSLPFLATAAALVVEQGGLLSHVALLARQFSIPTVVCPGITSHVREGEAIRVDADQGWLELPERTA
jgi:phosphohistidine swiveling domain-containing protein